MKGLSINVQFLVSEEFIQSIILKNSPKGIQWEIMGDCKAKLQNDISSWMEKYINKKNPDPRRLPLNLQKMPPFTKSVLETLCTILFGEVISYKQLALLAGNPKAIRAAGTACGRNPFPLVIPCHRVIASDDTLGGFAFGLAMKQALLDFEKK